MRKYACISMRLQLFWTLNLLSPVTVLLFFRFSGQWIDFAACFLPLRLCILGFGNDEKLNRYTEPLIVQTCLPFYAFTFFWDVDFAVPCFCVAVFSFFWVVDNLYRFRFAFTAVYFSFWR